MGSSDYRRVSRKRACRICGKTDWCSYTPDEKISFCAREIVNSDRLSRTGWGVFYHEKTLFPNHVEPPFAPRRLPSQPKPELAPIEIRDFVYRKLLALAPATDSSEITEGEKGLRARKILDFENYGALPQTRSDRRELAKIIRNAVNREFPDYVRKQKTATAGLPGFWLDERGRIQLWTEKDYACPLMLIPYRDEDGFIQACQIRFMCRRMLTEDSPRYVWLSTPEKSGGASCGSPLHFARRKSTFSDKPFLVTEGALKAETAQIFKPNFNVISAGGVTCSHEQIVSATRFRPVFLAFDGDYAENFYVARAIARLISFRTSDAEEFNYEPQINILFWDKRAKGIDDALLLELPTNSVTPVMWFASLNEQSRKSAEVYFAANS